MKKVFNLGKIDYKNSGKKNCPVEVKLELREQKDNKLELSICGTIWNPKHTDRYCSGQCLDTINNYIGDDSLFKVLYYLWKNYHLNTMHAGTPKQEAEIKRFLEDNNFDYDYNLVCEHLTDFDLMIDDGYRYGSAWLYEPIPEGILEIIRELLK